MSNLKVSRKRVILVFVRYYLPGYRAGGPVRSLSNLVRALESEYDFHVVCFDRDHGTDYPHPNVPVGQWHRQGEATIRYSAPHELGFAFCKRMMLETRPDMIYLNSLFDRAFSMVPFLALGRGRGTPMLLTPRGELSPGALGLKAGRKRLFLSVSRAVGLYKGVHWHACSKPESDQIQKFFSPGDRRVFLASNLPELGEGGAQRHMTKQPGKLRIVLAARVAPMKNTLAAIRIAGKLPGTVELDLWGPLEDKVYWGTCQQQISLVPPNITVRYRGEVEYEKLHDLLQNYDVMLMPTLGENFGHAIIEALDAGLPVVISDRTPWRDLERHGIGADLPLDDEAAFLRALARYQAMDEAGMTIVRDACRRYVVAWRANNTNLGDYRKMFDTVIASRKLLCK